MPTYVYSAPAASGEPAIKAACEVCSVHFEIVQKMSDDALTHCPKCGGPVERIIMAPNLNGAGKYKKPSDDRLAKAGFTQYKRSGKGHYEKSFGKGPTNLAP